MKLSPTATTLILSFVLLVALVTSILSLSTVSWSSVALQIITSPLDPDQQHHDIQHHSLHHNPQRTHPDSKVFGLSDTDRFLSYSASDHVSDPLQLLRCAIRLSKLTGRKILVHPHSVIQGDNQFSLSWLQILNINSINSQLNPSHRPCLIRGLNYGEPNLAILEYVYNGTLSSRRDECTETPQDAPWQLRDPNSWSTECYLLPWALTPHIARNVKESIPFITSTLDHGAFRFPGNGLCGKAFLKHNYHFLTSGLDSAIMSMDDKLILLAGDSMTDCESPPDLELPSSLHIESITSAITSGWSKPVLCIHAQSANFTLLIQAANDVITVNRIRHTVIITDALNDVELNLLHSGLLGSIDFGCDHNRFPVCRNSDDMRDAIEQQVCANADFFIGSSRGSFTKRVMDLRQQRQASIRSSFLFS